MFNSDTSTELPDDIVFLIFSYFELHDVPSVALVNKQFNSIINDSRLWQMKFKDQYPHLYITVSQQNHINWFKAFYTADKETKVLKEFLDLLKYFEEQASQFLGLSSTRPHAAATTLKKVLFNDYPASYLTRYSLELSNPTTTLGKIYAELNRLDLIKHAKKYYMDLIEPNDDYKKPSSLNGNSLNKKF